jgi:pyridoxine 5-phosphate synthase
MTKLSVNVNKIALLRNSRGRNFPDVAAFAARCLELGAHGITLHPRPDQRHARDSDVDILKHVCDAHGAELNVEGYPTAAFLGVVSRARPAQCTLVPDAPGQLTSDHGWDFGKQADILRAATSLLKPLGIRVSVFVDHENPDIAAAKELGADRVELYTEPYAEHFGTPHGEAVLQGFAHAAAAARSAGLGVNAGHDLDLDNLARFLEIPGILEVSIGHALIVECIEHGVASVIPRYVAIVDGRDQRGADSVLKEFPRVAQHAGEPRRRWFQSDDEDLIVWFGEDDHIRSFQLCYNRKRSEHALSWNENAGYSHARIDDGEAIGQLRKSSPILLPDGKFDGRSMLARFKAISAELPQNIADFVQCKIEEYPGV